MSENKSTAEIMAAQGWVSPGWVAEKTGKCLSTIYNWIRLEKLGVVRKVGRESYVSVRSVINHLGEDNATALGIKMVTKKRAAG